MDTAHLGRAFHGGQHYENFPVASWLIPARVRPAMLDLYRFARCADDLADEGDLPATDRIAALSALERGLRQLRSSDTEGDPMKALFHIGSALGSALKQHHCAIDEALALLKAFHADIHHQPMQDDSAVLDYCRHSANPVGRLVLSLFGILRQDTASPCPLRDASDAICTGLQLANFAQDLGQDVRRGRIYFPKPWWPDGWEPTDGVATLPMSARSEIAQRMASWARTQLEQGMSLPGLIRRHPQGGHRLALEVALTISGGLAITSKVTQDPLRVWETSPRLSRTELMVLLFRALRLTYVS